MQGSPSLGNFLRLGEPCEGIGGCSLTPRTTVLLLVSRLKLLSPQAGARSWRLRCCLLSSHASTYSRSDSPGELKTAGLACSNTCLSGFYLIQYINRARKEGSSFRCLLDEERNFQNIRKEVFEKNCKGILACVESFTQMFHHLGFSPKSFTIV